LHIQAQSNHNSINMFFQDARYKIKVARHISSHIYATVKELSIK